MDHHKWMQSVNELAVCPKCREYNLHRSTAHGFFEKWYRRATSKRPYRCRTCGWRGWLQANELRYPGAKEIASMRGASARTMNDPDEPINAIRLQFSPLTEEEVADEKFHLLRSKVREREEEEISDSSTTDNVSKVKEDLQLSHVHSSGADEPEFVYNVVDTKQADSEKKITALVHERRFSRVCPNCGDGNIHRSYTRGFGEFIRKKITTKRPFRCHKCQWRGWLPKH